QLLAVVDERRHGRDEVAVDAAVGLGGGAELDRLGRVGQGLVERAGAGAVTAEVVADRVVERGGERLGQTLTHLAGDVAGVGPDDLSGGHPDRGQLLRGDGEQVQRTGGGRLAATLRDPVGRRLAGDDRDRL